jgi:hypothetical protein
MFPYVPPAENRILHANAAAPPSARMMASAARTRVCNPERPRPSPMLDPFHPQVVFAGK